MLVLHSGGPAPALSLPYRNGRTRTRPSLGTTENLPKQLSILTLEFHGLAKPTPLLPCPGATTARPQHRGAGRLLAALLKRRLLGPSSLALPGEERPYCEF